jgi:hypothetical protein
MKTIFTLLAVICVGVLSCSVYCGWTGHGLLGVQTVFVAGSLMLAMLLAIVAFCFFQFVRKGRGEWKRWLLRTVTLTLGWAVTFYIILLGPSAAIESGKSSYWKAHKTELESLALKQLEHRQVDGFYYVPTNEVAQLDYPVFVHSDSSNGLQVVGFSHWSTTPGRRGGFLFVKVPSDREISVIQANTEWLRQLNTNWFEYTGYRSFKSKD